MVVATPWERTGAPNNWQRWGKREKFNIKLERLWEMILGCTVVNDPAVFAQMDRSNNRIVSHTAQNSFLSAVFGGDILPFSTKCRTYLRNRF